MGTCMSTQTTSPRSAAAAATPQYAGSKSPPPVDEETVKQVLTETKLPPPQKLRHDAGSDIHSNYGGRSSTEKDAEFRWPRSEIRPFPGEVKREKNAERSPARRLNSSPGRVKSGSGCGRKMAAGGSPGRRSRSPVIRSDSGSSKTGLDANKSWRKTGNYSGRVGFGSGESILKGVEEKERQDMTRAPTNNELLENSLVSLECFIFL